MLKKHLKAILCRPSRMSSEEIWEAIDTNLKTTMFFLCLLAPVLVALVIVKVT